MKARRRAVVVTALVASVMVLPVPAAHADVTVRMTSPTAGHVFADAEGQAIRATTTRGYSESRPGTVNARVVTRSGSLVSGTQVIALAHVSTACDSFWTQPRTCTDVWEARSGDNPVLLNPATLQPFGNSPSCNGAYGLQPAAEGGSWGSGNGVIISLPPTSPSEVNVTTRTSQATVTWRAPDHPDLTGFEVEQRQGTDPTWEAVAEVGPDTTSLTRSGLDGGPIEFRVRAVRGDGLVSGAPAAPCSDTGRDLASAWSPAASGTVPAARFSPSPSPSPSPGATDGTTPPDDGTTPPDDGATDPDDGATDATDDSTEPTEDATEPGSDASPSPRPRTGSASRAAPPRVESQERRDASAPEVSGPEREERFFGDDMEFSEELDFGGAPPDDEDRERGTVTVPMPGALQNFLGTERVLNLDQVLVPVAGGMILLSLGLHLRRWTRLGLE